MKVISIPGSSDISHCRRKDLLGKRLALEDGVYVINRGKPGEHTVRVHGGYIDGGDSPAINYEGDGHTEYWSKGFPEDRSDGSPAIVSCFGLLTENWHNRQWTLTTKFDQEMEI